MRKTPYLLLLSMAAMVAAQVSQPYVVDFETRNAGPYTEAMAKQDFMQYNSSVQSYYGNGSNSWYSVPEGRAEIVDESGNKALRVKYPEGCVGTDPDGCAIQIRWAFHKDEVADTMWASYRVKFEEGFEFVKGGKLPGLCGGKCYTGGNTPQQADGWSARIMWRAGGNIVQYVYFIDQAINYGDDMKWDFAGEQKKFQIGVWHNVATQVIFNTIPAETEQGNKDGIIRSWLDGEQALEVDTIRFVDFAEQKINRFYFSTFHGGSDNTWAPTKDVYVLYDDFRISISPPEYLENSELLEEPEEPEDSSEEEDSPGEEEPSDDKEPPSSVKSISAKEMSIKFAGGILHFSQALQEQATFKLIDLKGNIAWQSVLAPGQSYLKLPALSKGVYVWQIKGKGINLSSLALL